MKRALRISLLAVLCLLLYRPAFGQVAVGISVSFGPPALPVYEQPPCPEDGWIWVPGYWAWDADDTDYYWVPGTWVAAPEPGYLWTPAWWGWESGAYLFHEGYWGTEVGFYGGINYGFGYWGHGFYGGRWNNGHFFYNTAVWQVNTTVIRNVYVDRTVIVNNHVDETHVSYNGGEGGVVARPTEQEQRAESERHIPPVAAQTQHVQEARGNPQMRARANQGKPSVAATERPAEFSGHGVVEAKAAGAPYHPPANRQAGNAENAHPGNEQPRDENTHPENENARPAESNPAPTHARDLQPHQAPPPEGNSAADQKYQQQQEKLVQKQNQEHQNLAAQQEQEDQQAQQKKYNQQKQQQMEQKHQQQTQQLEQRHQQQQQKMQQRRPQPKPKPKPKEPQ